MKKIYSILIVFIILISCSNNKSIDSDTVYVNLGAEPKQ